eukprot:2970094-Prymnesium_polylepis.1
MFKTFQIVPWDDLKAPDPPDLQKSQTRLRQGSGRPCTCPKVLNAKTPQNVSQPPAAPQGCESCILQSGYGAS